MIGIRKYNAPKSGVSTIKEIVGNTTVSSSSSNVREVVTELETHKLWGNDFNGTQDIDGDLVSKGNITAQNVTAAASVSANDVYAANGDFGKLYSVELSADTAEFEELQADGSYIKNLKSDNIKTDYLTVTKQAHFFELVIDKIKSAGGSVILTPADGFKVARVKALAEETILDMHGYRYPETNVRSWDQTKINQWEKIGYTGGGSWFSNITNASSFKVGDVALIKVQNTSQSNRIETLFWEVSKISGTNLYGKTIRYETTEWQGDEIKQQAGYRLHFLAKQGETKISNMWEVNDMALCQSFNRAVSGYDVSNKYYWCLVTAVGTENIDGDDYHYIDISTAQHDCDGDVNPEVGDEIVMLGNREDTNRGSAIYIAAYNSLDKDIEAPLMAQYRDINDFNLSQFRYSCIAKNYNQFIGDFRVQSSQAGSKSLADYITSIAGSGADSTYLYFAWANSADGSKDFSKTNSENRSYLGVATSTEKSDDKLTNSDYSWTKIKGADGEKAESDISYWIKPIKEVAQVTADDKLTVDLEYQVYRHYENNDYLVNTTAGTWSLEMVDGGGSSWWHLSYGNNPKFQQVYDNYYSKYKNITYYVVKLIDGVGGTLAQRTIPVTFAAGATFEVRDNIIKSVVTDNIGGFSTTKQTSEAITSAVGNVREDLESTITQTKDSIEQKVTEGDKAISTLLANGRFTINANTVVNGSLTISNVEDGFRLINTDGSETIISPQSVGNLTDFNPTGYDYYTEVISQTATINGTTATATFMIDLGVITADTTLKIDNYLTSFVTANTLSNSYRFKLLNSNNSIINEATTDFEYLVTADGSYRLQVETTATIDKPVSEDTIKLVIRIGKKGKQNTIVLGSDGLTMKLGDMAVFAGNGGVLIDCGGRGLRITPKTIDLNVGKGFRSLNPSKVEQLFL